MYTVYADHKTSHQYVFVRANTKITCLSVAVLMSAMIYLLLIEGAMCTYLRSDVSSKS